MIDKDKIEHIYDELPYHRKEAAKLPYTFLAMSVDQQIFFYDFVESFIYELENPQDLLEDLNLIKSDLEAVIAKVKK